MISEKIQSAINDQIKAEFDSSFIYLAMAAYCDSLNFKGFGFWFKKQAEEELGHAHKFIEYLNDRGGRVIIGGINTPAQDYGSVMGAFQKALEHEKYITGRINSIYDLAMAEKDYATQERLNWYVKEQVEEEATASEMLEMIKMGGDKPGNLMYLDRHAAKRGQK